MKIKISKSQWKNIGKNAGWLKQVASAEQQGLMDKILKEYSKRDIARAIKSLGEESIAGFSNITVDDVEDILSACEKYELHEIEKAATKTP